MSKGDFSSLGRKPKPQNANNFIESAAVDGRGELDPKATRNYKSIRLGFNEYEYKQLEQAASDANLPLVTFIRLAWMKAAKD